MCLVREREREHLPPKHTDTDARWLETTDLRLNAGRQAGSARTDVADTGTGTSIRRTTMRRGAPSRRVRAAPTSSSIIPPFSSLHPHIITIPSPPIPAVTSGPVLTRFTLPHHGSSSRRGAPMRFGWLAPLVPDSGSGLTGSSSLPRALRTRFRRRSTSPRSARDGSESCAAAECSGTCGGTGSWF